jgi:saccharopine dehydrogenase-like NADP-dependent oxidoreductase
MNTRGILIAGGYGVVGGRIAAALAADYPDRLIVAGRNIDSAKSTAAAIGHGVRGRALDVMVSSSIAAALDDVAVVMSCIDQPGRGLLHAAIGRGLRYTDITPHLTELGRGAAYEKIDAAARASGACLVLGTGIVPGIANVMVRALADGLGGAEEIVTSLLLSARDVAGPASFDYFLQELSMPFKIHVNGADLPAYAFSGQRPVEFPPPVGMRSAYLFPFSDQVLYPRTMGARTALTRLAIEPTWLAKLLVMVVRSGAAGLVSREAVRHAIARRRTKRVPGEDNLFALRVDVTHDGQSGHATLLGRGQADAAAAGAAGVLRVLLDGDVARPGAWMPEQVIDPGPFFARLATRGLAVELALVPERVSDLAIARETGED